MTLECVAVVVAVVDVVALVVVVVIVVVYEVTGGHSNHARSSMTHVSGGYNNWAYSWASEVGSLLLISSPFIFRAEHPSIDSIDRSVYGLFDLSKMVGIP